MKKFLVLLSALTFTFSAYADVIRVNNERSARYYLNQGSYPSFLNVRVKGWGGDRSHKVRTVKIKYARYLTAPWVGKTYPTKEEAIEGLKDQVAMAKRGNFTGKMAVGASLACGVSINPRKVFGRNTEIIEELIAQGYMGAGNYSIETEINSDFEVVYRPIFTLYIPCKY